MPRVPDPLDALLTFQQDLLNGHIRLREGELDPELYVHAGEAGGAPRFTYVRLIGLMVKAYAVMDMAEPKEDLPCFEASVAIPAAYRGQGLAKGIVADAMAELKNGLARNNAPAVYVEAIVGAGNEAAKHVAAAALSKTPVAVTDSATGLPALQYVRKL